MKSHTLWSEVVEIVTDARAVNADLLVTLGAGSLTDGAKLVALLGPLGVGHGETSCILLPARVLGFLTSNPIVSEVLETLQVDVAKADLGDVLDAIIRELGLSRSLVDVGVGRDKLDRLAVNSLEDRCCVTNPVPLKEKEQVLEILEMVVGPQA
ncbi:hypothetical protein DTO212C5_5405 [Paecilomyces variotii]|nr:hypothetical protein DTO212C5_5405 [Paecilomyces variotii]